MISMEKKNLRIKIGFWSDEERELNKLIISLEIEGQWKII